MATLGVAAFILCVLGCMNLNFGRVDSTSEAKPHDGQVGTLTITGHQTMDVYYPSPYLATPNLTVENSQNDCRVVEQKPTHFRMENPTAFAREITWTARGEKVPSEVLLQSAKQGQGT